MAGKERSTPFGVLLIGQVLSSWFSKACAPSLAVAARSCSRSEGCVRWSGFESEASKRPRSKVYGVGFVTNTGSFEGPFEAIGVSGSAIGGGCVQWTCRVWREDVMSSGVEK